MKKHTSSTQTSTKETFTNNAVMRCYKTLSGKFYANIRE